MHGTGSEKLVGARLQVSKKAGKAKMSVADWFTTSETNSASALTITKFYRFLKNFKLVKKIILCQLILR